MILFQKGFIVVYEEIFRYDEPCKIFDSIASNMRSFSLKVTVVITKNSVYFFVFLQVETILQKARNHKTDEKTRGALTHLGLYHEPRH